MTASERALKALAASDFSTEMLYNDDNDGMTFGRKIANYFYKNTSYNPNYKLDRDVEKRINTPSLDKAWEYFEHHVLPRCLASKKGDSTRVGFGNYARADVGEYAKPTMLYPIWQTPIEDMGDFGVGVGLYFSSLRFLAFATLIAGCINIPIMWYFNSESYLGKNVKKSLEEIGLLGSAVCVNTSWEICPTCTKDDWETFPMTNERLVIGTRDDFQIPFIKKNRCNITDAYGVLNITALIFIVGAVMYWLLSQKKRIEAYEKSEFSSTDYSIEIKNPPKTEESLSPETWKAWLESTFDAEVVACTIILNNDEFIKALIKRRKLINQFREMLTNVVEFDIDELQSNIKKAQKVPQWKQILLRAATPESIYHAINQEQNKIDELSTKDYDISSVIVTFQCAKDQQKILHRLVQPILSGGEPLQGKYKYEGIDLKVTKPAEPSAIRWDDLHIRTSVRMMKVFVTTIMSFGLIIGGGAIITLARKRGPEASSFLITCFNLFTPRVVKLLTSYESHPHESSVSASQYLKVTAFRWTNTALVTTLITPFTDTLQNGEFLIKSIFTMFMFDLVTSPTLQLLDIGGNLRRHLFGPRKSDQRRMNLDFRAATFDVSDKYTNVTRIFFFTLFYCSLFPSGFFFASAIFASAYWIDKYSILRTCGQGAKIGTQVAKMSNVFFLLCLATGAVMMTYNFAQFPFDNACETDTILKNFGGIWELEGISESVEMGDEILEFKFCNQDLMSQVSFPPLPSTILTYSKDWMNEAQNKYATIMVWVMLSILVIIFSTFILWTLSRALFALFFNPFKEKVHESDIPSRRFDDIPEITGYVPQVFVDGYAYPFLLCDTDNVNAELIGWEDPYSHYDSHNVIFDVKSITKAKQKIREVDVDDAFASDEFGADTTKAVSHSQTRMFSMVKSWGATSAEEESAPPDVKQVESKGAFVSNDEEMINSNSFFCCYQW